MFAYYVGLDIIHNINHSAKPHFYYAKLPFPAVWVYSVFFPAVGNQPPAWVGDPRHKY